MFDNIIVVFQSAPWLFYTSVLFFGLCVGSFLNVVAYRLPLMMERDWKLECHEFLELEPPKFEDKLVALNLATPASACPNCGHKLRPWENIPVISYLFLRAKCSSCSEKISIQYPIVELITGIASLYVAFVFGVTIQTLTALLFTWVLIALTLIDLKKQLLPDDITLPLLWSGILLSFFNIFTDLTSSVIGAMAGYMILWSIYQLFKLLTKKEDIEKATNELTEELQKVGQAMYDAAGQSQGAKGEGKEGEEKKGKEGENGKKTKSKKEENSPYRG